MKKNWFKRNSVKLFWIVIALAILSGFLYVANGSSRGRAIFVDCNNMDILNVYHGVRLTPPTGFETVNYVVRFNDSIVCTDTVSCYVNGNTLLPCNGLYNLQGESVDVSAKFYSGQTLLGKDDKRILVN